ncbi:HD domain-containing protein [Desulfocapsa sp. AH-315-G09]|nr:HD domain-containing protein [Desulfocapsa sp.]MBN4048528.1 HD domain-containing protein [bacterium AH-315-N22]MBN4065198.1 HD domain-containing protein [Desulfocapsa sp. AH-315-G09]
MHSLPDKQEILFEIVSLLSKILYLDAEEHLTHGLRIASLSQAIAKQLHHDQPTQLFVAGLLHNIGGTKQKESHSQHIQGTFRDLEERGYSTRGAEILQSFHLFQPLAGWIADHHERYDGTGFPEGKARHAISSEAGILHLADLLDMFITTNPRATLKETRLFLNKQSASSVDPMIVEAAKQCFSAPENLAFFVDSNFHKALFATLEIDFPGLHAISIPELISQLLWLTALVSNSSSQEKDFYSNRVAFYCHRIVKSFDIPDLDPIQALWAGLLHDIGNNATATQETQENPELSSKLLSHYQQHPMVSADLVTTVNVLKHFRPILAAHHEYWNGTGFPTGLKGNEIPLLSQIIGICEYYEDLAEKMRSGRQVNLPSIIAELEKERDRLFSSQLLDVAIPVFNNWGSRNISWMQEIKNVHAFFTSDPFDNVSQENETPRQTVAEKTDKTDNTFFPRQWSLAKLSSDFTVLEGDRELGTITNESLVEKFFDIVAPSIIKKTRESLKKLEESHSLTLTLLSRQKIQLEVIFIKSNKGYNLLYRGINKTPLFTRTHSIFYQHFKNSPEALLLFDKESVITDVNKSGLSLLGFSRIGLVGKELNTLFSPFLSKPQISSLHMLLAETGDEDIWLEEFSIINNQGTACTLQVTIEPLPDYNDQPTYLCRLRDVSSRKKMEEDLVQRDHAMQLIVHNISGLTGENFFKSLLQQFEALTKATFVMVGELVSNNLAINPLSFRQHGTFQDRDRFLLHGTPSKLIFQKGEVFFPNRLQEFFPLDKSLKKQHIHSCWGLPLRSQDGTVIGVLVAMDDNEIRRSESSRALVKVLQSLAGRELSRMQTERKLKQNEQQLESQNIELTRMSQIKSDMIAITSHDLKSPLSAIIGYANILSQYFSTLPEEKIVHYIRRIEEEGEKQLTFINKLLDLYRIESGEITLEREQGRLDLLVTGCIDSQEHVASERNIVIHFHVKGSPALITFDPTRMEQVVSNILSNAIKFSPDNSTIDILYRQDEASVLIEICDHGSGIDEEEILHIFDRYYMGRTDFEIRPEGSGLGLYIVKNIITLHGGDVSARNRKKGGSCFSVWIPANN